MPRTKKEVEWCETDEGQEEEGDEEGGDEEQEDNREMTVNDEIHPDDLIQTMTMEQIERFLPKKKYEQLLTAYPAIETDV